MSSSDKYFQALLSNHEKSPKVREQREKGAYGGILPIAIDREERKSYFLFGVSKGTGRFCHFHGFVEKGETIEQGTAREAWEESKGILGTQLDLWRALQGSSGAGEPTFSKRILRTLFLISLGDLDKQARTELQARFQRNTAFYRDMDEARELEFVETKGFMEACLRYTETYGEKLPSLSSSDPAPAPLEVKGETISAPLRDFTIKYIFAAPKSAMDFWASPTLAQIMENQDWGDLRPLSKLPPLQEQHRSQLLRTLYIPTCDVCHGEGHCLGVCVALSDPSYRRDGTWVQDPHHHGRQQSAAAVAAKGVKDSSTQQYLHPNKYRRSEGIDRLRVGTPVKYGPEMISSRIRVANYIVPHEVD